MHRLRNKITELTTKPIALNCNHRRWRWFETGGYNVTLTSIKYVNKNVRN